MSEDRLGEALQEMTRESVDAGTLDAARARVWEKLTRADAAGCAEFRSDLASYVSGTLTGGRRLLLEDHISRCAACRVSIAEMKGERRVVAMPQRSSARWRRWAPLAAAAALVVSGLYLGRDAIDDWMAPGGPRATVASINGGVYSLPGGALQAGAAIGDSQLVRTSPGAHAVLRLTDGSTVDVNERTEMFVTAAWSGQTIHLERGDVIVKAAKQRRGHLRVLTRDSIASVKGTVFAVSAGIGGSVVSVVEGSVQVNQPGHDLLLSPGQQAASNPALTTSVAAAVSWSPDASEYLELLASFAKVGDRMTRVLSPLRTSSALLSYLPAGAFVYGAVPNPGGNFNEGVLAAEQQAFENAAFRAWWTSDTALQLRRIVDRIQSVSSMLGEEVVFSVAAASPDDEVPMVIARIQPGQRSALTDGLASLFAEAHESSPNYSVSDELIVISDSSSHLAWAVSHLGQDAGSPFAAAIGDRYVRGAGWLVGVDAVPVLAMASGGSAPPVDLARLTGLRYLFFEQRAPNGAEENEVTAMFQGTRSGIASWLADAGSGGAAEFLPADALAAGYVSMRQPAQLFQEFTELMSRQQASFQSELSRLEEKLGAGFAANLSAAMGTEAAFAVQGVTVSGPTWVLAALVNDPTVVDSSIGKLVDACNADVAPGDPGKGCTVEHETAGGLVWNTLKSGSLPIAVNWTYYGGYVIVASDRGTGERAIATKTAGSALIWSSAFQAQLPASAGLHPSAFVWLNTKGALDIFSALSGSQAGPGVLAGRDPVLMVLDGKPEQIHLASRTRVSSVAVDAMLLGTLSDGVRR
ncbi:MAG TPA: FecR domain-containing protein [Vicinamibacterales bacterium]|nr:FecR domain-containing protein [Vicinamibacterales bacterium]